MATAQGPIMSAIRYQPYKYRELNRIDTEIRLLRVLPRTSSSSDSINGDIIHCELCHVSLRLPPKYDALSYTWGESAAQDHYILVDGQPFPVRTNLWGALNRFRNDSKEAIIWIDAICINQANIEERQDQVGSMRSIYQQASRVLVWLGPADDSSHVALQFVHDMYEHRNDVQWLWELFDHAEVVSRVEALAAVLSRPYWNRIWIVQEIAVAQDVTIFCGDDSTSASALHDVQEMLYSLKDSFDKFIIYKVLRHRIDTRTTLCWRGLRPIWASRNTFSSGDLGLFHALQYNLTKLSTDPRDMVYGLVGLTIAAERGKFKINYSATVVDVYTSVVKHEVSTSGRLDIITYAVPDIPSAHKTPSWVPDWSVHRRGHTRLQNIREPHFQYTAAGRTNADARFLDDKQTMIMRGLDLGVIKCIGRPTKMEDNGDFQQAIAAFGSWWNLHKAASGDTDTNMESLGRTLLANRFRPEEYADLADGLTTSRFLQGFVGAFAERLLESSEPPIVDPAMLDCVRLKRARFCNDEDHQKVWTAWIQDAGRYMWDRRLFLGSSGSLGLAPSEACEGDVVCLPLGCSHPVLLRSCGDHYVLIGELYVDGIMYGEAMNEPNGSLLAREFVVR